MTGLRILLYIAMVTSGELTEHFSCYACYCVCSLEQALFLLPTALEHIVLPVLMLQLSSWKFYIYIKFDPEKEDSFFLWNNHKIYTTSGSQNAETKI